MPTTEKLKLTAIQVDWSVQPRANGLDQSHVDEIADKYRSEDRSSVPPPVVWLVGGVYRLAQGFHRIEAAKRAGLATLACVVEKGDEIAWRIDAACSNKDHGLKRTPADRRRAVAAMLAIDDGYSDRLIAEMVSVSHVLVADVRKSLTPKQDDIQTETVGNTSNCGDDNIANQGKKRKGKDGKEYKASKPKKADKPKADEPKKEDKRTEFPFGANAKPAEDATAVDEPEQVQADPLTCPDAFVKAMESTCYEIDNFIKSIRHLEKSKYARTVMLSTAISQIEAARKQLWSNRPSYVCSYCKGQETECRACKGTGRLGKAAYERGVEAMGDAA